MGPTLANIAGDPFYVRWSGAIIFFSTNHADILRYSLHFLHTFIFWAFLSLTCSFFLCFSLVFAKLENKVFCVPTCARIRYLFARQPQLSWKQSLSLVCLQPFSLWMFVNLPFSGDVFLWLSKSRYLLKLKNCGLKDCPYQLPVDSWLNDPTKWPTLECPEIQDYLINTPSVFTREKMKNMKSLEAHNQFRKRWVQTVFHIDVPQNPTILLKSDVLPSQG